MTCPKTIRVVAALLRSKDGVLVAKRSTGNPDVLGKWEFPGGKIEPGETAKEAIEREIAEEFGIKIIAGTKIAETTADYPSKRILLELIEADQLYTVPFLVALSIIWSPSSSFNLSLGPGI